VLCALLTSCPRRVSAKITTGLESTKLEITQTYAPYSQLRRSTNCVQTNCRTHTTTRPAAKTSKPGAVPVEMDSWIHRFIDYMHQISEICKNL
jgi:hypothetical protein